MVIKKSGNIIHDHRIHSFVGFSEELFLRIPAFKPVPASESISNFSVVPAFEPILVSAKRATFLANLIHLNLIILITLGEEYKL
jgi:hypothetical protein